MGICNYKRFNNLTCSWQYDLNIIATGKENSKIHIICPSLIFVYWKIFKNEAFKCLTIETSVLYYVKNEVQNMMGCFLLLFLFFFYFTFCNRLKNTDQKRVGKVKLFRQSGSACIVPGVLSAIASDICYLLRTSGFSIHSQKKRKSKSHGWG